MAEEQFQASGNWWETPAATRNMRFESDEPQSSSFGGWQQQQHDTMSASGSSSVINFHDNTQKLQPPQDNSATSSNDPNLHMMMGLGLSTRGAMDWNQASLL